MAKVTAEFEFTCDNQQLAIDETTLQIKQLDLTVDSIDVIGTRTADEAEDDWFDDVIFTIRATVSSETLSESEIKQKLIEDGNFECCEC